MKKQKCLFIKKEIMRFTKPKGILIPIGGGEDKKEGKEVLCRVIEETGKKHPCITLVTLATSLPEEAAKDYQAAFTDLKITKFNVIHFNNLREADTDENMEKVNSCNVIMFSGGDQLKLSSMLGGTGLLKRIRERYYDEPGFVVAGTSAGAAAMSNTMIVSGSSEDALIKGELELTNGLDLINSVFIDTHFTQRGRIGRLIQTVTGNPGVLGVGLGEDTSLVIHKGDEMEVVGSGLVIIVDGREITYTDGKKSW
jgi:cyanophycinase